MTVLKKIVSIKQAGIFQIKLENALTWVLLLISFFFCLFLCLKRRKHSKIVKDSNTNIIEGATILKTLPTDV